MDRSRRYILGMGALLAGSSVSWASSSSVLSLDIQPGGRFAGEDLGRAAIVEPLEGDVSVRHGQGAQVIDGVELFKIDVGDPSQSDQLRIHFSLLNPAEIGNLLNNPNSYFDIGIWYDEEDVSGSGDTALEDGTTVVRDEVDSAAAKLTESSATSILRPSEPGIESFYILASITVPGGSPPGQQPALHDLDFHADVRK